MMEPFSPRKLLLPLVPAYRLALLLSELRVGSKLEPVRRLRWPVVSIGNLSTGGAGKTPLTIALAKALKQRGIRVDVLSRGYGRRSKVPALVDPGGRAEEFGDEPLLIAREAGVRVYVAAQRYEAGLLAEQIAEKGQLHGENPKQRTAGPKGRVHPTAFTARLKSCPDALGRETSFSTACEAEAVFAGWDGQTSAVHLLDDGFQHRQLARDVDILLLNGRDWQDGLLPAGNLREPLEAGRRASVIAIPAEEPELEAELRNWGWTGPVWRLHRTMEVPDVDGPVAAFCGIARPEQFFDGLEAAGLHMVARIPFPDHHRYTAADLDRLASTAAAAGAAALITTEKDLARLGTLATAFPESLPLRAARLTVEIEDEPAAIDWLAGRLSPGAPEPPL
jgi:tetraacyldisaccharide 4'-kinase